jgi:ribosomal protein S18 acetylase RimI-like enzyme
VADADPAAASIRPARPADLPALGRLGAQLVRLHRAFDPRRFFLPEGDLAAGYARFLGSQLGSERAVVLVAERGGELLGYAYAGLEPRSWQELREEAGFLHDVVVDERARGQGVGARLVEAAAAWLEARGAPRVMLWTAESNAAAQRLFDRHGFRRTMVEMTRERREG